MVGCPQPKILFENQNTTSKQTVTNFNEFKINRNNYSLHNETFCFKRAV